MSGTISLREATFAELEDLWRRYGVDPAVEQIEAWTRFHQRALGWSVWAVLVAEDTEGPAATMVVTRVPWHGQHYLWARHAPVWLRDHDVADEAALVEALRDLVRARGDRALHLTLNVSSEVPGTALSSRFVTYDTSVCLDLRPLQEGESVKVADDASEREVRTEAIISRMKARGRRDVRAGGRRAAEAGIEFLDEWEKGAADFSEHHAVMVETGARDGFTPWAKDVYQSMLSELGSAHSMLMSARREGVLLGWCLITMVGKEATYFYAASSSVGREHHVMDRTVLEAAVEASMRGCERLDMMGIGSDRAPSLRGLNQFKTKFSPRTVEAPHAREIVLRPRTLALMEGLARLRRRLSR